VDEVAEYLKTEPSAVRQILTSGELAGFKVGGEWGILGVEILEFLKKRMEDTALRALAQAWSDPRIWAREAQRYPELLRGCEHEDFQPGTFGHLLKSGITLLQAETEPENVVDIRRRQDKN